MSELGLECKATRSGGCWRGQHPWEEPGFGSFHGMASVSVRGVVAVDYLYHQLTEWRETLVTVCSESCEGSDLARVSKGIGESDLQRRHQNLDFTGGIDPHLCQLSRHWRAGAGSTALIPVARVCGCLCPSSNSAAELTHDP